MQKIIMICTLFCSTAFAYDLNKFGVVEHRLFNVRGISIGDTYDKVIDVLGEPLEEKRIVNKFAEGKPIHLYYEGIYLFLSNNEVMNISITGIDIAINGVTVGDGVAKVISVFGTAKLQTLDSQTSLRYIAKSKEGKLTDAQLIFLIRDEIVTKIILWYDFT